MAEVASIVGLIHSSSVILNSFAGQVRKWKLLSDRLFDIQEGLDAAELTMEGWRRKYDVQNRRPVVYMHVLFGRLGWERIQQTLGSIRIVSKTIGTDIEKVVGRAIRAKPRGAPERLDGQYDVDLVQECIRRIRRNTSWSRKFNLSVLDKAGDLEMRLERLFRKLSMLERFSDYYLEKEHPDIFQTIERLPGRRVILKIGDARMDSIQNKLLSAVAARRDAELLHRASGQGNRVHIGLSVPQIHKRDFAFLLFIDGQTHERLFHPVKIKAINDSNRVQSDINSTIQALIRNSKEPCYLLPSPSRSEGFQVSIPPSNLLKELEYRDPLSSLIAKQRDFLGQQVLYPQDQVAIACGITQGCFRLLGSQWLKFLDCKNVRWRRSAEGKWTTMMAAVPGDSSTNRTLEQILDAGKERRDRRDLRAHCHIFRIGLLLAELALKTQITYIEFDSMTGGASIYISELDSEALDATEIAAEVDLKANVMLGNIVFFCLSALQERDMMGNKEIEGDYYNDVVKQAEQLETLIQADRKRRLPLGTPSPH
ncbi:hypothetical protein K469DRAFT_732196 [Zopfia rhizophila CBS 207.26]|uniref:Uncharacterized protein n=1 Tax=Zopfia rhizophila CBS 207.26 TaxID=1314779 RepID=A0A6A6DFI1_9PEZI|nr:hypothetical protein K469DRAFT_732196 [Zopfia rhizophila CBS 207.26]